MGKFIVFDGADCLGKTTQIEELYKYLLEKGEKVIKSREPGGTTIGSKLRDILLNSKENIPSTSELLLFFVDRNIHYTNLIAPYLEKGYTILCDRYILSTLVYQSKIKDTDEDLIYGLHELATGDFWPDLSFIFHGERLNQDNRDLYEEKIGDKHQLINSYYKEYASIFPDHILIDANRSKEDIQCQLRNFF